MFVNGGGDGRDGGRDGDGDGGVVASSLLMIHDENAVPTTTKTRHAHATKTPHRTPNNIQRRAFGDISNRKVVQEETATINTNKPLLKSATTATSSLVSKQQQQVSFAKTPKRTTTTVQTTKKEKKQGKKTKQQQEEALVVPVSAIEVSAGRTYRQQQEQRQQYENDDTLSIDSIEEEERLWQEELFTLKEAQRMRPVKVHQQRIILAEQQYLQQADALWKQDDADLAAEMDRMLLTCPMETTVVEINFDLDNDKLFALMTDDDDDDDISF